MAWEEEHIKEELGWDGWGVWRPPRLGLPQTLNHIFKMTIGAGICLQISIQIFGGFPPMIKTIK